MIRWWNAGRYERECAATVRDNVALREMLTGQRYHLIVVPRDSLLEREHPPDPWEVFARSMSYDASTTEVRLGVGAVAQMRATCLGWNGIAKL